MSSMTDILTNFCQQCFLGIIVFIHAEGGQIQVQSGILIISVKIMQRGKIMGICKSDLHKTNMRILYKVVLFNWYCM